MSNDISTFIAAAQAGTSLSREQARDVFNVLLSGEAAEDDIIALLTALRDKGESKD